MLSVFCSNINSLDIIIAAIQIPFKNFNDTFFVDYDKEVLAEKSFLFSLRLCNNITTLMLA